MTNHHKKVFSNELRWKKLCQEKISAQILSISAEKIRIAICPKFFLSEIFNNLGRMYFSDFLFSALKHNTGWKENKIRLNMVYILLKKTSHCFNMCAFIRKHLFYKKVVGRGKVAFHLCVYFMRLASILTKFQFRRLNFFNLCVV